MPKKTLGINSRKVIFPGPTRIALRALPPNADRCGRCLQYDKISKHNLMTS